VDGGDDDDDDPRIPRDDVSRAPAAMLDVAPSLAGGDARAVVDTDTGGAARQLAGTMSEPKAPIWKKKKLSP
jgi:hypothetical protein